MLQSVNSEGKNFEIASTYKPLCMHTHLMTGKGLRFTAPSQNIILPFFRTSAKLQNLFDLCTGSKKWDYYICQYVYQKKCIPEISMHELHFNQEYL